MYETQYFPLMHDRALGFFLPPPALLILTPLAFINLNYLPVLYEIILTLALFTALFIIVRSLNINYRNQAYIFSYLCLCGFAYEPIRIGQLSTILLLGLVCLLLTLKNNQHIKSGLLLNLFWLKPQLIIPLSFFLLGGRRYQTIIWAGIIACLIMLILWLVYPSFDVYVQYKNLINYCIENSQYMQPELNATFRGQMLRILPHSKTLIMQVSSIIWLICLLAFFIIGHMLRNKEEFVELGVMLIIPAGILTSLHCYNYDLIFLLPSLLLYFVKWSELDLLAKIIYCLFSTSFLIIFHVYFYYQYLLKGGIINPYFILLLVFVLTCYKLIYINKLPLPRLKF